MSAFLKLDRCASCQRDLPWEWVPPVQVAGKSLAGTGVWRSGLVNELCGGCIQERDSVMAKRALAQLKRQRLIRLLGGVKPFREFTFDRFEVAQGNRIAFESAKRFDPSAHNLFLWGPGGTGKTHLAYAIARRSFWQGWSVILTTPGQLIRTLRMKTPEEEQRAVDAATAVGVLVLDAFGTGGETAYARQALQEILDGREYQERRGLVVSSRWAPAVLARSSADDRIASRLVGMCDVVEVRGADRRLRGPAFQSPVLPRQA